MRKALFLLVIFATASHAVERRISKADLPFLPKFCMGTQDFRTYSNDPIPISTYVSMYGAAFIHLHHYCYALNGLREASTASLRSGSNGATARDWYEYSRRNIEYVLNRSNDDFVLLPEILTTYARVLHKLGNESDATSSLEKAIRIAPGYLPAYFLMSDFYERNGKSKQAVDVLQKALARSPGNAFLIKEIKKLGSDPDPRYLEPATQRRGGAVSHENMDSSGGRDVAGNPDSEDSETTKSRDSGVNDGSDKQDRKKHKYGVKGNPYCRFCAD